MQHLNDEELARLADEEPTPGEAAHLSLCEACAGEVDALRAQLRALAGLPDLEPPPALQARLQAGLAVEGLMLSNRSRQRAYLRIAASVALFAAGGLGGFLFRGATAEPGTLASGARPPATVAEAAQRVETTQQAYNAALAAYAEKTGSAPTDPVSRLAALEGIVLTTRAALNEAPADPVINGYHLTALEQRDALLRQLQDVPVQQSDDNEQEWY